MQFKDTLRAITLTAFSCLLVFSCITVDKTIGSDYIPENQKMEIKSASIKLPVTVKMTDSLQGITSTYSTIGAFRTKEFGEVKFGVAGNISPTSTTLDLGEDPVIKSTYLCLLKAEVTVGASLTRSSMILDPSQEGITQNINVYRLKRLIDSTTLYTCSITEEDYDPIRLNASASTYYGGDTIKVFLDNKLGTEILNATTDELDSLDLFAKNHYGLYVTCDAPAGNQEGGRMNLFNTSISYLYLKYNFQPTWDKTIGRKDTTIGISFGYGYALNTTQQSSENLETKDELEYLPIEGMAGVVPYVDVKDLKKKLNEWAAAENIDPAKIIVSKATLIFPFELPQNLDEITYKYPAYLFPTNKKNVNDTTNVKYYYPLEDYNSTDNPLGVINRSLFHYSCDVSSTIQKIINKKEEELDITYNFWMYPLMSETDRYYGNTYYNVNNYSYFNAKINGPAHPDRQPELQIIYAVME